LRQGASDVAERDPVPNLFSLMEIACDEIRRALVEYTDGDLSPEHRAEIDQHLRNCEHCRAIYDGVRNVVGLVGSHGMIELPKGFSERLRARLISGRN
jgi:anti-sigma factor RsiW